MSALVALWRRLTARGGRCYYQAVPMTATDRPGWHAYRAEGRMTAR